MTDRRWACSEPLEKPRHHPMKLEDCQPNAALRDVLPDAVVTRASDPWLGSETLEFMTETAAERVANDFLYRHGEPRLEPADAPR